MNVFFYSLTCLVLFGLAQSHAANVVFDRVTSPAFPDANQEVFSGAWGDYDGDGRPDLFLAGLGERGGELLRNTTNGFVRVATGPLASQILPRAAAAWGDADNDGSLDLLIAGAYSRPDSFFVNDGKGGFQLRAVDGISRGEGISVLWNDVNRDGWLDAFVVNGGGAASEQSYLLLNDKAGGLVRVTEGELAQYAQYSHGAAFGDYDGDGDDDLLLTSAWGQPNALFRNDGGQFVRTSSGDVGTDSPGSATASWGDFDNDGDLDLLLMSAHPTSLIFRNDGGVLRRLISSNLGDVQGDAVGAAWADFDNDGILDVVIARRSGRPGLHLGLGDGSFAEVNTPSFTSDGSAANSLAIADYDLDGDLDIWFSNWGPASAKTSLYRNDTRGGNYLRIRLAGRISNRAGVGAKVRVSTRVQGREVWQLRVIGGFESMGSHELVAHFGLGQAAEVEAIRVEWPSGVVQQLPRTAANQLLVVDEISDGPIGVLPNGGTFDGSVQVSLHSTIPAAEIRFTTDGSDPSATSTLYSGRFSISSRTTLKARLFVNGFPVSEIRTAVFTPLPPVRFSPAGGMFTNSTEVSITSSIAGSTIRFTVDGSEPAAGSGQYVNPLRLTSATTVKARAFLNGFPVSEIVSSEYRRVYSFPDDGVPFAWREQYFGTNQLTDPRAAAEADPDGDGTVNRQEFIAGSNPLDPLSGFKVGVRAIPEIRFASVAGRTYRILRVGSIPSSEWKVIAEIVAKAEETVWIDPDAGVIVNPAYYLVQPAP